MPKLVLIAGESHAGCVSRAAAEHSGEIEYRAAARGRDASEGGLSLLKGNGQVIANPAIAALLKRAARGRAVEETMVLSVFAGNFASRLCLLHTGIAPALADGFDDRKPVTTEGLEFIPACLALTTMIRLHEPLIAVLKSLREAQYEQVLHLEGPPPARDETFILDRLPAARTLAFDKAGARLPDQVSPASHRLAFWRLQTRVVRQICKDLGVIYVSPPEIAFDKDGFLIRDYQQDAVHANVLYGQQALAKISGVIEGL